MANELKIANGLILDFDPGAAGGSDFFLLRSSTGLVTELSSIPASRISSGGDITEVTSSVLTITGGTGAALSGVTILVKTAATGQSGYLTSTDWNTFNNKLGTSLTNGAMWVGNVSNVATAVTMSGDVTITNAGVAAIAAGVIVNADINASAAIAFSKMAALTVNLVTATNGSGVITTVAGLTTTIAGYLTNITSDVQAQFTTTNQRIVGLATNAIVKTPTAVQDGYAIVWSNGAAEWTLSPVGGGGGSVTGPGSSTDNAITRWNGTGGTSIQNSAIIIDDSDNVTGVTSITVGTSGLHLLDTDASHDLILSVGSNITADRTLTVTTGDADRTITLSGNPTLSDWFDQSVKAAASPSFADVTVSNATGLHILDSDSSHDLILRTTSNLTADRELIFVPGDATRTLTINASGTLYVTGGTDVAVADGGTGLSAIAALSLLVANSSNTFVALTPGAGNGIRVNAGGTAWEAFTPGSATTITVGTTTITSGTTTRIPFNDAGVYAEDSAFTWDKTNDILTVGVARIHSTGTTNFFAGEGSGNTTLTGIRTSAIGYHALTLLSSGNGNTVIGYQAGSSITTQSSNTLIGDGAGTSLTGASNILIGAGLSGTISSNQNIIIGVNAATGTVSGGDNIGVGFNTFLSLTSGVKNIAIGTSAGSNISSGGSNVLIGYDIDAQSATTSNQLAIQNAIFGSANTGTGTTVSSGNIGFFATTWGTSAARVISIGNGTAPSTSIVDGIQLYAEDVAASSELKVRDEAGNTTTLSPHNFSLIGAPSEDMAWAYYSEREGKRINVDMLAMIREVEKMSGRKLVFQD